jgi:hypothetical protein
MSEKQDPSKPVSNDEKFKPQNVAEEGAAQPGSPGRLDREMNGTNTARGSEPSQRGTSGTRR